MPVVASFLLPSNSPEMSKLDSNIAGKRILVTGAGRGIGYAMVESLVAAGATKVFALCILKDGLDELKKSHPKVVESFQVDLTDWSAVKKLFEEGHFDKLDGLVNNAGIVELLPVGQVTEESFDRTFAVNVKAALNLSQLAAHDMIKNQTKGSIVNMSSQASAVAIGNHLAYCASKAALDGLTRVMALELGVHGIRCNSIRPTVTLTSMAVAAGWKDPKIGATALARIPLGRFAEPHEIVNVVLFLLGDASSMITGASLAVDGGYTAC